MPTTKKPTTPKTASAAAALAADESRREAERLSAAHALLTDLEKRNDSLAAGDLLATPVELRLLAAIGIKNLHELSRRLGAAREIRYLLEDGVGRPAIAAAEEKLAAARQAENETAATAGEVPAGVTAGPVMLRQLQSLESRYEDLREATAANVATVESRRGQYAALLRMAPKELHDQVAALEKEVRQSPDAVRLNLVQSRLRELRKCLDRSRPGNFHELNLDAAATSSMLWAYLQRECPAAIDDSQRRRSIKASEWRRHLAQLETETLPGLETEVAELRPRVESALAACQAPLHDWAEAGGVLSAEMLLAAD